MPLRHDIYIIYIQVVHDVRVFADKASYAAHIEKTNPELTKAMADWFEHYDRYLPYDACGVRE